MKFLLRSVELHPGLEVIQILRRYTDYSIQEIKKRFAGHETIFEFDRYDAKREILFQVIHELKAEGLPLEFYESDGDFEEPITEEMIHHLFQSSDEYSAKLDREGVANKNFRIDP